MQHLRFREHRYAVPDPDLWDVDALRAAVAETRPLSALRIVMVPEDLAHFRAQRPTVGDGLDLLRQLGRIAPKAAGIRLRKRRVNARRSRRGR